MGGKVADLVVEVLESAGVKTCYGIVGDTLNHIAHAIEGSSIKWVHMRHEEAGAFAAGGQALLTGQLTACAGTCGPGSLHFINGLYEANRNRAPVLLIATQIVTADMGLASIQEVDFTKVFEGCSVYCETILTPEHARKKTVAACQAALTRQGVAVLIVPVDIANSAVKDEKPYSVHVSNPVVRPSDAELDEIAAILNGSSSIAIYAGAGCAGAHDLLIETAERLKAPIAHTSRGKDFVEHNNPYSVGMTGILGEPAGYHAVLDCSTLLLLGADFAWSQFYPDNAEIIQIDRDPTHIGRRHPVTLGAVGDIKATLEALLPRLIDHESRAFMNKYLTQHARHRETAAKEVASDPHGLVSGTYLTKVINRLAADDALIAADDGTPTVWMLRHIDTHGKRRTFASLLHGTMAGGLGTAIGLQKSAPHRQVICLAGDGGLSMLLGDMLTIVQEDLPIKIVVYDNGKLGFVEIEQKASGLMPVYTDLKNPNFGHVATAMGIWGRYVGSADELEAGLTDWRSQPGPALLHVKVTPMQLVAPPSPLIAPEAVVGMAIYGARAILQGKGHDVWEMVAENR